MTRRAVLFVLVIVACLSFATGVLATTLRVAVYVDGRQVGADALLRNGRTYLPARAVAEALGCSVRWDAARKAVYVEKGAGLAPKRGPRDPVYVTSTGEQYHRATCRRVSRMRLAVERQEATEQGYLPCKECKP